MASSDTTGKRIKAKRLKTGLSQAELADKVGVTQPTIANWETGRIVPSADKLRDLGKIIGRINLSRENRTEGLTNNAKPSDEVSDDEDQMPSLSAFGAWVNRERNKRGLSVPQLADSAGVSAPTIYGIESGTINNPRDKTQRKITKALGTELPSDIADDARETASISGLGELIDFNPHEEDEIPTEAGIYVLYDISARPIYVGQASSIKRRIREHSEKFWFRAPIVQTGAYILVGDATTRAQIEKILIKFLKSNAVLNIQNVER